jgi:hypothetical protein
MNNVNDTLATVATTRARDAERRRRSRAARTEEQVHADRQRDAERKRLLRADQRERRQGLCSTTLFASHSAASSQADIRWPPLPASFPLPSHSASVRSPDATLARRAKDARRKQLKRAPFSPLEWSLGPHPNLIPKEH